MNNSYAEDYENVLRYSQDTAITPIAAEVTSPKAFGNQPPITITYTHKDATQDPVAIHYPDHSTSEIMQHAHSMAKQGFSADNLSDVLSHDPGKPPEPTHTKATERFRANPIKNWFRLAWHNTTLGSHLNPHATYKYLDAPIKGAKHLAPDEDDEDERKATSRLALLLRPKMANHE